MFTKIEADVPLYLPNLNPPVHAELKIDRDDGDVEIAFHYNPTAENLTEVIRFNQLLGLKLDLLYINDGVNRNALNMVLTEEEQQLADKLTDAGLSQAEAETWVSGIVGKAFERGQSGSGL